MIFAKLKAYLGQWTNFLTALTVLLACSYCSNSRLPLIDPPGGKSFWALAISDNQTIPYVVPALFAGNGQYIEVFKEIQIADSIPQATVDELIFAFDNQIAPIEHQMFGPAMDVDGNQKVTVLLLDIRDGNNINEFIAGYFDPWNLFSDELVYNTTKATTKLRSNERDMVYMDTYPSKVGTKNFLSTLAHEYQHLLHFSYDYKYSEDLEEKWVDEGLSELASDLTGFGPQNLRLNDFTSTANNSLIKWDNKLADYSNTYVYFRMLADAYDCSSGSCGILTAIFNNPDIGIKGVDEGIRYLDPNLVSSSACYAAGGLTHEAFHCSYRQMWANLLSYSSISGELGNNSFSGLTIDNKFAFNPSHTPFLPPFSNLTTLEFDSLRYGYFKKNSGQTPTLDQASCPSECNKTYFTLIYQNSAGNNYLIYNHTEDRAAIVSRTPVVASVQSLKSGEALQAAALMSGGGNYKHMPVPFSGNNFEALRNKAPVEP